MDIEFLLYKRNPDLVELLKAIRYLLERCRLLTISRIVGVARYMEAKTIKKGKHVNRLIKKYQPLFIKKGRGLIQLTDMGRTYLSHIITHQYPFNPLQLRVRKGASEIDTVYYLDGFYLEKNNIREPFTMIYIAKIIFLKNERVIKTPLESDEAIAKIKYVMGKCNEEFNIDSEIKVEGYPAIAHLAWYAVENLSTIRDPNLKHLIAMYPEKIYTNIEQNKETWIVKTPRKKVKIPIKNEKINLKT